MIDYDKLKLAHELADKYTTRKPYDTLIYVLVGYSNIELRYSILIYQEGEQVPVRFGGCEYTYEIDELIAKLEELTTQELPA